jgi:ribonuclease HII
LTTQRRAKRPRPTIGPEKDFSALLGSPLIAGVDEAGRGPIAGPVVAAAVLWAPGARRPAGITDSKLLTANQREKLAHRIKARCLAWGIGFSHANEIDLVNILEATRLAAVRAVEDLEARLSTRFGEPQRLAGLVTDALEIPALNLPTLSIIKGDQISASVASASILAKTARDAYMDESAREYPGYGWESNRGYPTEEHYEALMLHGPTTNHRMTFRGVGFFCERLRHSRSFEELRGRIESVTEARAEREQLQSAVDGISGRIPPCEVQALRNLILSGQESSLADGQRP